MLIQEIILENFMSYEYARIPFKSGVNVVCGPNGSGKSSILLGISVALGQSYTERSRKLSDLIRWGKDLARVTLILDNSRKKGRRPIPKIKKDQIFLSRILRRDGKYWFELENKAATKGDVTRLLSRLGVDPDNMLIIMHQNMLEQFTVLSDQEKLRMVEAAVGFESYRQNVLGAQQKLSRILSQEESVGKLLESAEQTLSYWREQYDRYQEKKQLMMKRRFLQRELAWAEVLKREKTTSELEGHIQMEKNEISGIENETKIVESQLSELQGRLEKLKIEGRKLLGELITLERERARHESNVSLSNQALKETVSWAEAYQEGIKECLEHIEHLESIFHAELNPVNLKTQMSEIRGTWERLESKWVQQFNLKSAYLKNLIEDSNGQIENLDIKISDVQASVDRLNFEEEGVYTSLFDFKIKLALLQYRKESLLKVLEKLNKELRFALTDLGKAIDRAEEVGPKVVTVKSVEEILDEIRVTDGHLAALTDVSEDIERMYDSYSKLYLELKEKARMVAENREKALEEVKMRMVAWRTVIQNLLNHVSPQYQAILSEAQAIGGVQLINGHDIEVAGLQILVGFKGANPVALDAYTQSGGERSTATMAFLLALQQHVRSPLRAIDEYDIHMDPKNREIIANLLISSVKGLDAQYLSITPSQVTFTGKDVHIITVQNVEGTSMIKEVF